MATGYSNRTLSFLKRYPQATFAVTAAMLAASIFTITSETPVASDRKLGNTIFELLTSSGAAGHASGTTIFHIDTLGNTVASGSYTTQANKNCTVLKTTSSGTIVCSTSTFTTSGDNDARYVNTSGDTMTGNLVVQGSIRSTSTISGSTLSGNLLKVYQITPRHISAQLVASGTALAVGSGTVTFRVPPDLDGFNLTSVFYCVDNVGVTGTAQFQIYNRTDSTFMLSTPASIDTVETCTTTAAAPPVVNGSADDVATNDLLQFGTPAIHTTAAKGLFVRLTFAKP